MIGKALGERRVARIAESLANSVGLDLLTLAFRRNGILNAENDDVSGESYFLNSFLKKELENRNIDKPVIFDVGANIGKYTTRLSRTFANAEIYSFEPNPNSYKSLSTAVAQLSKPGIRVFNIGLSAESDKKVMYSYQADIASSHASLLPEVLTDLHRSAETLAIDASFVSFDEFCQRENLRHVHFLKIDTEGYELEVLKGAKKMIELGALDYIQFEFGECHVYSRVFFRDFYNTLSRYQLYRLLPDGMRAIQNYSPDLEIFHFQNIVAVSRNIQARRNGV
jgi:FkbM family methyltransferase